MPPAAGAGSEGVAVFVGGGSGLLAVVWLRVVVAAAAAAAAVVVADVVEEAALVSEVDALLALVSFVRVPSATTAPIDVLEALDAELEELASVMLK